MAQKATEATDAQPAEYRAAARINRDHAALAQTGTRTVTSAGNSRLVAELSEDEIEAILRDLKSAGDDGAEMCDRFLDKFEDADADTRVNRLAPYPVHRKYEEPVRDRAFRHDPYDASLAEDLVRLVEAEVEALATHKYADDGEQLFFECEATGRLEPFKFHKSGKYAGKQVKNSGYYYESKVRHIQFDQMLSGLKERAIRGLQRSDHETIGEAVAAPDGLEHPDR